MEDNEYQLNMLPVPTEEEVKLIRGKNYYINPPDVVELANKIILEKKLFLEDARVGIILVDPKVGGKDSIAKFIKTNNELHLYSDNHYIIEISKDVWDLLPNELQYRVLEHNLRHIFVDVDDNTGEYRYLKTEPNIQEYFPMLQEYGVEWISELKTLVESIRQLDVLENIKY